MKDITTVSSDTKKEIVIDNLMVSRGVYSLVSDAKVGKSMFALQLAYALTYGFDLLGLKTIETSVLYISTESDINQVKERCSLLNITFQKDKFMVIDRNDRGTINLASIEDSLKLFSEHYKGKVVIIDMLKDIDIGINYDINNYQDVCQRILDTLRELCIRYDFTILFTHHLNKKGKVLGSTAYDASVDGKITLNPTSYDKKVVRLITINRDFKALDILLKNDDNQIFSVANIIN
ncbi:MAG: AAA family ATPase [bacterium]